MPHRYDEKTPWFLLPFEFIWNILSLMINRTGKLAGILSALLIITAGILMTTLPAVAPLGIPLVIFGLLLLLKAIL